MSYLERQQEFTLFAKMARWKHRLGLGFLAILITLLLLLDFSFVRYRLMDASLAPAYWGGQKVITLRWAYVFHSPQKLDYIVYKQGSLFIPAQIIAVPGDNFEQKVLPPGFVGVVTDFGSAQMATTVPIKLIKGKILGKWQVLLI